MYLNFVFILSFCFLSWSGMAQNSIEKRNSSSQTTKQSKEDYLNQAIKIAKIRCSKSSSKDLSVNFKDFKWYSSLLEIKTRFYRLYETPKRLINHMYYDPTYGERGAFKIPPGKTISKGITVTENFIKNTILHIEAALKKNYADYINLSDMGHSHFLIPSNYYNSYINHLPMHLAYEKIMAYEKTKSLYHTAEQLNVKVIDNDNEDSSSSKSKKIVLIDDPYLKYRYFNRNIIGDNELSGLLQVVKVKDPLKEHNTVRSLKNHRWWGNGIDIHSNKKSCIPYTNKDGKTYYFDINLDGTPSYDSYNSYDDSYDSYN